MNMQYEIAKMVTNNQIPDEEIDKGLALLSQEEWDKQCAMLDKMMKEHVENRKDKPVEEVMLQDLINVGAANNVSATTVWVAYLKWLDVEYVVPYKMQNANKMICKTEIREILITINRFTVQVWIVNIPVNFMKNN